MYTDTISERDKKEATLKRRGALAILAATLLIMGLLPAFPAAAAGDDGAAVQVASEATLTGSSPGNTGVMVSATQLDLSAGIERDVGFVPVTMQTLASSFASGITAVFRDIPLFGLYDVTTTAGYLQLALTTAMAISLYVLYRTTIGSWTERRRITGSSLPGYRPSVASTLLRIKTSPVRWLGIRASDHVPKAVAAT